MYNSNVVNSVVRGRVPQVTRIVMMKVSILRWKMKQNMPSFVFGNRGIAAVPVFPLLRKFDGDLCPMKTAEVTVGLTFRCACIEPRNPETLFSWIIPDKVSLGRDVGPAVAVSRGFADQAQDLVSL